ncbi:DUF4040 family protein [Kocuria indica]|uniref:DUF4040 family protein n=1 Tax=Kocuria marina subsp. indica TaxID=1049583 RepID=A0A6N9QU48_9MICC|nr:DUF4040 family protein [Kocuria indica]NDO76695.1 DUF4040 family protein [Kocuria indica]
MLLACLAGALLTCALAPLLTRALGRDAGWLLAVPLLGAAALLALGYDDAVHSPAEPTPAVVESLPWIPSLDVGLALRLDGLSLVFSLLVLVIGAAVLCYATRYLERTDRADRGKHAGFYALMTGFAAAMLALVLADDLVVCYVAWEATTLCSFLLIARSGDGAREPAIRTLLVTVAGGLVLLAAVTVMIVATGTTRISTVLSHDVWGAQPGLTTLVAVLVAVAAFTKSAQFPFQAWLPDSMVAITPVSAYLHAAAMVKAGIYLLLRFSPVFSGVPAWTVLLVTAGLVTAVFGAVAALRRYDLKELLAYSTMSQLGLLTAMIGVGTTAALSAAVVHTIAHALFKSALFMGVGVIDHTAHTRDLRELARMNPRMPVTSAIMVLAAASMAGIPLLLGFVSKESMLAAFLEAPGPAWAPWLLTATAALASVFTVAYSARLVLGALGGRRGTVVREAPVTFWAVPAAGALAGLVLGLVPFLLDGLASAGASAAAGSTVEKHLAVWHGPVPELFISLAVLATGAALVLARRRVHAVLAPRAFPFSALDGVDRAREGTIRLGGVVGSWTNSPAPARHLAIPAVCLSVVALLAVWSTTELPPVRIAASEPFDWLLALLIACGVVAMMNARSLISAIVVTGVVGFSITVWFFDLGATDVAMTQLLVEILTVCVMVLLLRRLPARFSSPGARRRVVALLVAGAAGLATTAGVWMLTGRREASPASEYYLTHGYDETGGSNLVNTILVDFRALDTLGELTVLGVAGLTIAALLHGRRPAADDPAPIDERSPVSDPGTNTVFVRTAARLLGPVIVAMSVILLLRGHYEPGGGFISALVGGAGFTLSYLAAPSDERARVRLPYLWLIGLGVAVGTLTGLLGYLDGSFLRPLHPSILGFELTTALVFDVGVYLAVIGVILAAFNLLGRPPSDTTKVLPGEPELGASGPDDPPGTDTAAGTRTEVRERRRTARRDTPADPADARTPHATHDPGEVNPR